MKMTIKISRHVLYRINSFVNKDRSEDRRFIYICMYILFRYIVFRTNKIFFLLFFFFRYEIKRGILDKPEITRKL